MKISTTKKAAILATVLSGFVLGSSAEAAKLGIVTASDYVTSHMGAIEGSLINSNDITAIKSVITGLNRDPAVYNTVDQATGESSIYIRQYNYSTTNLQNSYAFNGQDWSNKVAGNTSGAVNAHDVARYKDFVYVASYDEGTIGVAQVTSGENGVISDKTAFTRNLKGDLTTYGKLTFSDKAQLHGEGVVILDGNLYVVANCNPEGGYDPYSPSYLIKYVIKEDGRLSYDGYTTMGKNTDSVALNVYNNYMLATAIGGYQFYGAENSNADTSIDVVTLKTENNKFLNTRKITLPKNLLQVRDGQTIPKSEFRSLKVMPNGTAYVMTYNIGTAGKNVDVTVYQTTISNLLSKNPENWKVIVEEKAAPGWFGRLDAEQNTKRLWVQVGNKLNIYTDGATKAESFGTGAFASNPMYEELYTWDIISTDVIPEGGLVNLHITKGDVKPVEWKVVEISKNIGQIKNETYKNIETKDNLISLNQDVEGNLTNNVLAGIYADGVNSTVIANDGLQIQVDNNIASPVGIYAGNGGSVKFTSTSGNLDVLTKTLDGGNTLTNAIWLDPSKNGDEKLQITAANTNITMEGGYGGNGIAIQKTDRWGENSKVSTQGGHITIQGNVNIKGADAEGNADWGIQGNPTNVLSRFNNAGILVDVNNSSVTVGGNVDMDVYGNGVTVTGDNSTVTIKKGGTITVPAGTNYGYYALAAYDGTINMNADATANAVKLNGDVFATKEGTINLGLATKDSYLNGIIDNGGKANVTLKNGAIWTNVANNDRYYQDSEDKGSNERSHVTTLKGGTTFDDAGTIIQTANSKNLWVDNLAGAVKVKYDSYDVGETVTVNGGNVTIDTAEAGSLVGLYAPNKGFGADDTDTVNAVLNALANKLYYNGYMQRDAGLKGYVLLGEGITTSSIGKYTQEITFTNDGQGTTTGEGTGINPDTGTDNPDIGVDDKPEVGDGGVLAEPFTSVALPFDENVSPTQNTNAAWKDATITEAVDKTKLTANFKLGSSGVLSVTSDTANVRNNIVAAIYDVDNTGATARTVSGNKNDTVQIQVESDEHKPVAIYVSNSKLANKFQVKNGTINIITKANSDDVKTNAVWVDPSSDGGENVEFGNKNSVTNININMQGGQGGNGLAITKSDGTSDSINGGKITVSGNLSIKGTYDNEWGIGANTTNGIGRLNNAGILVDVDNSSVSVSKNVDMDVYGNGITVDAKGASVSVSGGNITVPQGTEYGYYALAAYNGYIAMNSSAANNDVKLNGDIFATKGASINLGLATSASYLNGVIDNGGTVDLTLINGAVWTNEANNTRYKWDNEDVGSNGRSHVTKLTGATSLDTAGTIIQTANSDNLYIDSLSGVVKINYDSYDPENITKINGGNVTIDRAVEGSQIALATVNKGIATDDEDTVNAVLNALANKLYYNAYVDGERNLTGVAIGIGEGLTASEVSKQAEIKFIETTGQGSLTGNADDGTGVNPDSGDAETLKDGETHSGLLNNAAGITITQSFDWNGKGHGVTVDAKGATVNLSSANLTIPQGTEDDKFYAINALNGNVYASINTDSSGDYRFSGSGNYNIDGDIYVGSNGNVHIGISGADNWLDGAIINEGTGNAHLMLKNNATWENVSSDAKKGVPSYVNTLGVVGGAKIVQTANSGDIVIDNFGGDYEYRSNTESPTGVYGYHQIAGDAKVYYEHDLNTPTIIKGGSIVINKASYRINSVTDQSASNGDYKGKPTKITASKITLCTDYSSNITSENVVNVLNSLANKLYYLGAIYQYDEDGNVKTDANGNPLLTDVNVKVYSKDSSGNWIIKEVPRLNAYVQINEGLTASTITAEVLMDAGILDEDYTVNDGLADKITVSNTNDSINATIKFNGMTGQGSLTGELEDGTGAYIPSTEGSSGFVDETGAYTAPIYGRRTDDNVWQGAGILNGTVYNFTDAVNVFNTNENKIDGGAWHKPVGIAISSQGDLLNPEVEYVTNVNLNNNDLVITNTTTGSGASITAVNGGKVEINNVGNIIINEKGYGPTAGIFANSGGEVLIDNADGGVVTIRTAAGGENNDKSYATNGAGIKTMNGLDNVRSKVTITGLVDIVADGKTCNNEALSAVASTIEVGGGNIQAINGAWASIRAYGEFVSDNAGVVNVNVIKKTDADGNILKDPNDSNVDLIAGAGNNKTTIVGDFVTNGGMGTDGQINVGLNGSDSYWIGNYGDTRGYGVTQGMEGEVNLYMKNGASWTGFNDGEMNVTMEGEGTTWYGFNICDVKEMNVTDAFDQQKVYYAGGLDLNLSDGALWINAISTQQKNADESPANSLVFNFSGSNGFIDMTGRKTFLAINNANHAVGSDGVSLQNTKIQEYGDKYQTGNLVISNYSGDTTVIYRRDDKNVTEVLGGTTTIKSAEAGSKITLSTDSTGIDMTNTGEVIGVLGKLAEKLFYTAYATENERNLSGKVQIAEGLTTSSAGKYFGDIEFSTVDGQGSMKDGSLTKPGSTPSVPPSGDEDDEKPEDKPVVPEVKPEQKPVVEEEIKGAITGDSLTDTTDENPYKDLIGKDDKDNAVIDFSKLDKEDSKVDIVKIESEEEGGKNSVIAATPSKPVIIDVAGKDLAVNGSATSEALGIQAIGGDVTIKDAGYVTITANAGETGSASAIYAKDGDVTIENSDTVKLIAKGNANDAVLHADTNSNVNIKGKVEITNTNGKVAVEVAKGSTVDLGGGVIGDKDTVAIAVKDDGSIVINKEGGQSVVINGKILLGDPQSKMMMMKAAPKAIKVPAGASSFNLTDDQSSMNDDVQYTGTGNNAFVAGISNGAKWTGNSVGGVDLDVILADGGAWTGYHEDDKSTAKLDMQISNGSTWTNTATDATTVDTMSGEGGFVEMSEADLAIGSYSGATTFVYANNYGKDVEDDKLIKGGVIDIKAAADGSVATMRTNNIGTSDKEEVERVLKALAAKLAYSDVANNADNLTGKVQIMEGMTGSSVTREGLIKFDASGNGSLDASKDVTIDYKGDYIYGDSETAMMKGAKSAMASTVMMWRSESNDLLQRMGDVRLATEESGVWAKYYGGKYEMDAQNTNFSTSYKAYQVGYDKAVGNGWNVGVAVSHNEGDSRYDRGGEGEMTVTSLSVYGNKDYGDGRYLGLILKGSQLKNEYEVFNNDGYKLEGDFKTWGTSISAEYGKRIEKGNGFYFDPSVELTIGHVQGKDYTATSDMLAAYGKTATMQVEQDDFNSIIGRVGFGIGQRTDKASYYAKLALAHEFGGDFDTHYTAEETKGTSISFGDTWYEMQLGGTAKLNDNSLLYATYERSFGGDVTEKWRVDAGLRVTF